MADLCNKAPLQARRQKEYAPPMVRAQKNAEAPVERQV